MPKMIFNILNISDKKSKYPFINVSLISTASMNPHTLWRGPKLHDLMPDDRRWN